MVSIAFEDLPPNVVEQAKKLILDAVGGALLGSTTRIATSYVEAFAQIGQSDECTIIGHPERGSAFTAALTNSAFLHQTELGEVAERAVSMPTSTVVPASLGVGERERASGKDLLRAVALACEALIRFGYSMASDPSAPNGDNPPSLWKGWFPPILLSPVGSATATSLLLGADETVLHHAWGLAVNLGPATVIKILKDGLTGKGTFMGIGCANGILAADLASQGIKGLDDIVDDWMSVIVPAYDRTRITAGLGQHYEMTSTLFKHFALVANLFPALEATFALLQEHSFQADEVEELTVEGYRRILISDRPVPPSTPEGVKGNLRWVLAVALVFRDRDLLLSEMSSKVLSDERVLRVAQRVRVVLNDGFQLEYPRTNKSTVRIHLKDGRILEREIDLRTMGKYYAPSRGDIASKFSKVSSGVCDADTARRITDLVWNLEELPDIRQLTSLLAGAAGQHAQLHGSTTSN